MIRPQRREQQKEFWIALNDLSRPQDSRYYDKLEETLAAMGFTGKVHRL